MKHIFTLIFIITGYSLMAQNVGIGTTAPAMKLHVQSADSALGVFANTQSLGVDVKSAVFLKTGSWFTSALASIGTGTNAARTSIFGFANTTPAAMREYLSITDLGNVGINISNPTFSFQVKNNTSGAGTARFEGSVSNSASMFNFGTTEYTYIRGGKPGAAVYINDVGSGPIYIGDGGGNVSIGGGNGIVSVGADGNIYGQNLVINGTFKMTGTEPASGKVLVSDATGNASWQKPGSNIGFRATISSTLSQTSGYRDLTSFTEEFDDGNGFNPSTGIYTVPEDGVYQFNVRAIWDFAYATHTVYYRAILARIRSGVVLNTSNIIEQPADHTYNGHVEINTTQRCFAGDKFYIGVDRGPITGTTLDLLSTQNGREGTSFSAVKIY